MNKNRKRLLQNIESIIGSHACRKDAATTKRNKIEELPRYRYPIVFSGDGGEAKTKSASYDIDGDEILGGYYKFGTTHLLIMQALDKVIDYFEENCGLDIDSLKISEGRDKLKIGRPDIGKVEKMMDSDGTLYRVNGGRWIKPEEFKEKYPNFKI